MDGNGKNVRNASDFSELLVQASRVESLLRSLDYAMAYVCENELEMQYVPTFHEHLVIIEAQMKAVIGAIDRLELDAR